jgi:hypothetical protein
LTYPFRRAATLATLLDRPDALVQRWDALLRQRPVVAVAAADAHARLGPGGDPYGRSLSLHVPSYEQVFRTLSISLPDVKLVGDAKADARTVIDAIRRGRVYSTIDALASPGALTFHATSGAHRASMGDQLPIDGPVVVRVNANGPDGSLIRLLADGQTVASTPPPVLEYTGPPEPAVYRVEVDVVGAPGEPAVPWMVSNPVYVGARAIHELSSQPAPAADTLPVYTDGPVTNWRIEKSVRSDGALSVARGVEGTQILFRYGLGGTLSESPFVAAVVPSTSDLTRFERISFTARSIQPMRLTFELRAAGAGDRRWGRSVYLDGTARSVMIRFDEMVPMGTATGQPPLDDVRDLLFVVDTVHTKQGASGQLWLDDVRYVR